jgi:hypothetical protein
MEMAENGKNRVMRPEVNRRPAPNAVEKKFPPALAVLNLKPYPESGGLARVVIMNGNNLNFFTRL